MLSVLLMIWFAIWVVIMTVICSYNCTSKLMRRKALTFVMVALWPIFFILILTDLFVDVLCKEICNDEPSNKKGKK